MSLLRRIRESRDLSQRALALRAGVAFRSVQLAETGRGNPRWSTLSKLGTALGIAPAELLETARRGRSQDTARECSLRIVRDGKDSWKGHLMELVDAFRRRGDSELLADAPVPATPPAIRALLAATVETLSAEAGIPPPWWCAAVPPLHHPWFVSGSESLKAAALVEAPVPFRRRNVFVLENFLRRA